MHRYTIVITKSAGKELAKLPVQTILRIREAVSELADDPRPPTCKKLKGFKDLYRIRVGDYCVIYSVQDSVSTVEILKIGDRKVIYSYCGFHISIPNTNCSTGRPTLRS